MVWRVAFVMLLLALPGAACAAASSADIGVDLKPFEAALKARIADAKLGFKASTDCTEDYPQPMCKLTSLPRSLDLLIYKEDEKVQYVQVNFDATEARNPDLLAETAASLCSAVVSAASKRPLSANKKAVDQAFDRAATLYRWHGDINNLSVEVRIDEKYPLGVCVVRAAGAQPSGR